MSFFTGVRRTRERVQPGNRLRARSRRDEPFKKKNEISCFEETTNPRQITIISQEPIGRQRGRCNVLVQGQRRVLLTSSQGVANTASHVSISLSGTTNKQTKALATPGNESRFLVVGGLSDTFRHNPIGGYSMQTAKKVASRSYLIHCHDHEGRSPLLNDELSHRGDLFRDAYTGEL